MKELSFDTMGSLVCYQAREYLEEHPIFFDPQFELPLGSGSSACRTSAPYR